MKMRFQTHAVALAALIAVATAHAIGQSPGAQDPPSPAQTEQELLEQEHTDKGAAG